MSDKTKMTVLALLLGIASGTFMSGLYLPNTFLSQVIGVACVAVAVFVMIRKRGKLFTVLFTGSLILSYVLSFVVYYIAFVA